MIRDYCLSRLSKSVWEIEGKGLHGGGCARGSEISQERVSGVKMR